MKIIFNIDGSDHTGVLNRDGWYYFNDFNASAWIGTEGRTLLARTQGTKPSFLKGIVFTVDLDKRRVKIKVY